MNKKRICIIATIIFLVLSITSSANLFYNANAGWFCPSMGNNMNRNPFPKSTYKGLIKADEPNRKWTVEEIFKKSLSFTSYYGEGEGDWIFANKTDRGAKWGNDWYNTTVQDNVKSARGLSCIIGNGDMFANMNLNISSAIAGLISKFMNAFVGEDFMVDGLVKIIGGANNDNKGLISVFFHSLYMPLAVIAILFMAISVIYKGLIQMKFREAISSIIWSLGAFIVSVVLMLSPQTLAKAPQTITSTITTCVLGALSGQSCLSGNVVTPSLLAGTECLSKIEGDNNNADMLINSLSCTIWKAFVLEPWAEEQFGSPYIDLYTYNEPEGGSLWDGLLDDGKRYCVNLASSESPAEASSEIIMDRPDNATVCNVALYQLYLMTAMQDPINQSEGYSLSIEGSDKHYDARWFDIIVPMASHDSNWKNWSGEGRFIGRLASTNTSILAVFAASLVLITLSIFGAAYKIIAVIMMAFAPLFFLLAIEPTKGKRIFLGWLETFVSTLLKYFAISMLSIVSLILYAGILSNTHGATAFISVIVLTAALLMYRKEVVDLIGVSNMGGSRLSNKAAKSLDWMKKQTKEKSAALIGGAIGGMAGAEKSRKAEVKERKGTIKDLQKQLTKATSEEDHEKIGLLKKAIEENEDAKKEAKRIKVKVKERTKGMASGASDSFGRAMRRGNSMVATSFRQANMTKTSLDRRYESERNKQKADFNQEMKKINKANEIKRKQNDDFFNSPEGKEFLRKEKQKDKVVYEGKLSNERILALDKFSSNVAKLNDLELTKLSKDENVLEDVNQTNIVSNEINARLRADTLEGKSSSPELFNNDLSNIKNLSGAEITLLMNIYRTDYINSGNSKDYDKYINILDEHKERKIINKDEYSMRIAETDKYKDLVASTGNNAVPVHKSIDNLSAMQAKNPEKYQSYMSSIFKTSSSVHGVSPELLDRENKRRKDENEIQDEMNKKSKEDNSDLDINLFNSRVDLSDEEIPKDKDSHFKNNSKVNDEVNQVNQRNVKPTINNQKSEQNVNRDTVNNEVNQRNVKPTTNNQKSEQNINKDTVNDEVNQRNVKPTTNNQKSEQNINKDTVNDEVNQRNVKPTTNNQKSEQNINRDTVNNEVNQVNQRNVKPTTNNQKSEQNVNKDTVNDEVNQVDRRDVRPTTNNQKSEQNVNRDTVNDEVNQVDRRDVRPTTNNQKSEQNVNRDTVNNQVNQRNVKPTTNNKRSNQSIIKENISNNQMNKKPTIDNKKVEQSSTRHNIANQRSTKPVKNNSSGQAKTNKNTSNQVRQVNSMQRKQTEQNHQRNKSSSTKNLDIKKELKNILGKQKNDNKNKVVTRKDNNLLNEVRKEIHDSKSEVASTLAKESNSKLNSNNTKSKDINVEDFYDSMDDLLK